MLCLRVHSEIMSGCEVCGDRGEVTRTRWSASGLCRLPRSLCSLTSFAKVPRTFGALFKLEFFIFRLACSRLSSRVLTSTGGPGRVCPTQVALKVALQSSELGVCHKSGRTAGACRTRFRKRFCLSSCELFALSISCLASSTTWLGCREIGPGGRS